jgi:hypothetical protein
LAYALIGSEDSIVEHPGGKVRLVQYSNPGKFRLGLREQLLRHDMVLGSVLTDETEEEQVFRVPMSARPLAYDANSRAEGAFSYSDNKLFHDLGNLLGQLVVVDPHQRYVIQGEVGRSVAIIEFTHPGERKLLLVPGAEILLQPLPDSNSAEAYYVEVLQEEFQHRFDAADTDFHSGFGETTRGEGV